MRGEDDPEAGKTLRPAGQGTVAKSEHKIFSKSAGFLRLCLAGVYRVWPQLERNLSHFVMLPEQYPGAA